MKRIVLLITSLTLVASLMCFVFASDQYTSFIDIPDGHWSQTSVNQLYANNIITGLGNGIYGPDLKTTRAQFFTIIAKAIGNIEVSYVGYFSDVPEGQWYTGWVESLCKKSIVSGYDNGKLRPDSLISRQEAARVVALAIAKQEGKSVEELAMNYTKEYADFSEVSDWAIDGMKAAINEGLILGSDDKIRPNDSITRAETAVLISRLMDKLPQEPIELTAEQVFSEDEHIVQIKTYDGNNNLLKTWFGLVIGGDGKIVTYSSILTNANSAEVTFKSGETVKVKSCTIDTGALAILKLNSTIDYIPIKLMNSSFIKSEKAYAIMYDATNEQLQYLNTNTNALAKNLIVLPSSAENQFGIILDKQGKLVGIVDSPKNNFLGVEASMITSNTIQSILYSKNIRQLASN